MLLSSSNLFVFRIQPGPKVVLDIKGSTVLLFTCGHNQSKRNIPHTCLDRVALLFCTHTWFIFYEWPFFSTDKLFQSFCTFSYDQSTFKSKTLCLRVTLSVMPIWVIPADYKYILFDYIAFE